MHAAASGELLNGRQIATLVNELDFNRYFFAVVAALVGIGGSHCCFCSSLEFFNFYNTPVATCFVKFAFDAR